MYISEKRRALMLRVVDGNPEILPIMHQFMSLRQCDRVLQWLIANRITGKEFVQWFKVEGKTPFQAMRLILSKLNGEKMRPVLVGRDYIPE